MGSWPSAGSLLRVEFGVPFDGGTHQRLERLLVEVVVGTDVDRAPGVAVEAGVEEARWIVQRRAPGEGHFDLVLVRLTGADHSVAVPGRDSPPLPFLDHVLVGLLDDFADPCEQVAAPVTQLLDPRIDQCGGIVPSRLRHGCSSFLTQAQRNSWMRTMLPAGSRRAQSRTP